MPSCALFFAMIDPAGPIVQANRACGPYLEGYAQDSAVLDASADVHRIGIGRIDGDAVQYY
jgi:hypothetical protein